MRRWLVLLLLFSTAFAQDCSTTLVGVYETADGFKGVLANLTVSISSGEGNVWVDTMPLTKIETQVSARLAREVACEKLGIDCSNIDFYYLLRSNQVMVGGPSAGGPMTVCTMALLLNQTLKQGVAMTGTINPDGSIGPVAGIPAKAQVLDDLGYKTFLYPEGLVPDGEGLSIDLIPVSDVLEAYTYYSGYEILLENLTSEGLVNQDFVNAMRLMNEGLINEANQSLSGEPANELLNESINYYNKGSYYSSASLSVRSLINSYLDQKASLLNESPAVIDELIVNFSKVVIDSQNVFINEVVIDHLYDLESYAITMDRYREAESLINEAFEQNETVDKLYYWSFAEARLVTAKQWATMIDYFNDSQVMSFKLESIRPLVLERLESARNAIAYAQTIVNDDYLLSAKDHLDESVEAYYNDELIYSLFESLKARAEANLMMELRGFDDLEARIDFKYETAARAISNSMKRGYLPLLSLSFLEYSSSFEDEPYQALLFLAYAHEFATLGQSINEYVGYYAEEQTFTYRLRNTLNFELIDYVLLILLSIIIGLVGTLTLLGY